MTKLEDQVIIQTLDYVFDQIIQQTFDEINSQVKRHIRGNVFEQVQQQIWWRVFFDVGGRVEDQVRSSHRPFEIEEITNQNE